MSQARVTPQWPSEGSRRREKSNYTDWKRMKHICTENRLILCIRFYLLNKSKGLEKINWVRVMMLSLATVRPLVYYCLSISKAGMKMPICTPAGELSGRAHRASSGIQQLCPLSTTRLLLETGGQLREVGSTHSTRANQRTAGTHHNPGVLESKRQRQENHYNLKASLVYVESFRLVRAR